MMEVAIIRDAVNLPEPTDREEHEIVSIHCCDASRNLDPADDRFTLSFTCASGRTLRLRLPAIEMQALGRALLGMGAERPLWRDEPGDD
jgi:hypothetical protein